MRTIVVRNVPESDMQILREDVARRGVSINDILLELIKERVAQYRGMKAQEKAA